MLYWHLLTGTPRVRSLLLRQETPRPWRTYASPCDGMEHSLRSRLKTSTNGYQPGCQGLQLDWAEGLYAAVARGRQVGGKAGGAAISKPFCLFHDPGLGVWPQPRTASLKPAAQMLPVPLDRLPGDDGRAAGLWSSSKQR